MKKNGLFNASANGGNNNINALLNMLMNNNKSDDKAKKDDGKIKNEKTVAVEFPAAPLGYQYAKLIEKHDALSKKIDLQNKNDKNNG